MKENIICVDEKDEIVGYEEKIKVHNSGILHRAFSIFVYKKNRNKIEVLLQKRQINKYHSGGLWSNTCCGHPKPYENSYDAAKRRLFEEMGLKLNIEEIGVFSYRENLDNDIIENEIDHVFVGVFNDEKISPNINEVKDYKWSEVDKIAEDLKICKNKFSVWFEKAFEMFLKYIKI